MKRAAEKQLRREDEDEDNADDVQEVSASGFKKADESVLAGRQIRGLPRRSFASPGASGAPPQTSDSTAESSPASRFTGFGTPSSTSFSLGGPQPPGAPKLTPAVPAVSPFSNPSTATTQPSSLFGPSLSSTASPATKAFASIVSSSSTPSESKVSAVPDDDMGEIEYFKAIRGLNVSFLSAVSKAIESDPFVDVAELLERYKSLRVSVKSDYDGKAKTTSNATAPTATKVPDVPKVSSFAMPAPPTSFMGFKPPSNTSGSQSTSLAGGFTPKVDSGGSSTLGSPFSFAFTKPAESTTPEAPKSAFSFGAPSSTSSSNTSAPSSVFSLGAPATSSTSASAFGSESSFKFGAPSGKPAGTTSSSSFSFGGSAPAPTSGSLFGIPPSSAFGGSAPAPTSGSLFGIPPSSAFGGSTFGSKDADAAKDKDKDADSSSKPPAPTSFSSVSPSNPFGISSTTGTTTGSNTGATTPEKDKSGGGTFSFGSASPGGKPSFFSSGFGTAKAGSIGNPVGFGFGSPPKTPDGESASGPVKSLPFSFGAPAKAAEEKNVDWVKKEEDTADTGAGAGSGASAIASGDQPPPMLLAGTSVHDAEGEGEEGEETVHAIRSKVYKMSKDKLGKAQWNEMGVGVLRLKKHKETDARRVLLRNSSTGKITINFRLHSGMNPTVADKVVSFMGHDDGVSVPYRIRMKTADQAKELKTALDREIEFVKGKSD